MVGSPASPVPSRVEDEHGKVWRRRLPLVVRVPLLLLGLVAGFVAGSVVGEYLCYDVLGWNAWAASVTGLAVGILAGTVCLIPFAWARQYRDGRGPRYRRPLPVRVLATLSAVVLPVAVWLGIGVQGDALGWPAGWILAASTVAVVPAILAARLLVRFARARVPPAPAVGPRPGDPLRPEDVFDATRRPVLTVTREHETEYVLPETSARLGGWSLHFDLGEGRWVRCSVTDLGDSGEAGDDLDLIAEDLAELQGSAESVPIAGLGTEAYVFTSIEHGDTIVWAQVDRRWVIDIGSSDHFGSDVQERLARVTLGRLPTLATNDQATPAIDIVDGPAGGDQQPVSTARLSRSTRVLLSAALIVAGLGLTGFAVHNALDLRQVQRAHAAAEPCQLPVTGDRSCLYRVGGTVLNLEVADDSQTLWVGLDDGATVTVFPRQETTIAVGDRVTVEIWDLWAVAVEHRGTSIDAWWQPNPWVPITMPGIAGLIAVSCGVLLQRGRSVMIAVAILAAGSGFVQNQAVSGRWEVAAAIAVGAWVLSVGLARLARWPAAKPATPARASSPSTA